jgi:hypothetical protein
MKKIRNEKLEVKNEVSIRTEKSIQFNLMNTHIKKCRGIFSFFIFHSSFFIARFFFAFAMLLLLTTCNKDHLLDCFKSSGNTVTHFRNATPFSNINLKNNVDLILHPDTSFYIKVTAGSNLIDGIITELDGNTLYIRNENKCNWMRSFKNTYTVEVGMDKPYQIYYDGSGDITCSDTIRSEKFFFECFNGSGSIHFLYNAREVHMNNHIGRSDIHAAGFTDSVYVYINDVGTMDASALNSNYAYVRNSSTGDCRIATGAEFGYEILYNGNIFYSGNPHIFNEVHTGMGKLIHL